MTWEKLSWICVADQRTHRLTSHASVPFPEHLQGMVFEIYFTPGKEDRRSNVCRVIDFKVSSRILDSSVEPDLKFGRSGRFEDCGTMGSCLNHHDGRRLRCHVGLECRDDRSRLIAFRPAPRGSSPIRR